MCLLLKLQNLFTLCDYGTGQPWELEGFDKLALSCCLGMALESRQVSEAINMFELLFVELRTVEAP